VQQFFLTRYPVLDGDGRRAGYDLSPRDLDGAPGLTPDAVFNALTAPDLLACLDPARPTFVPLAPEVAGPNLLGFLPRDYPLVLELDADALLERGYAAPFAALAGRLRAYGFATALRLTAGAAERIRAGGGSALAGWDYLVVPAAAARAGVGPGASPRRGGLLARGVAGPAEAAALRARGFDLFEGALAEPPAELSVSALRPDRAGTVRALRAVLGGAGPGRVAALLEDYPALVLRVLALAGSPGYRTPEPITSVSQAVERVGRDTLGRWLAMLLFTGGTKAGESTLLFREAHLRGVLTRRTLKRAGVDREAARGGYLAGILLVLPALLRRPAHALAAELGLGEGIVAALRGRAGTLGEALTAVERLREGEGLEEDPVVNGVRLSVASLSGEETRLTRETLQRF